MRTIRDHFASGDNDGGHQAVKDANHEMYTESRSTNLQQTKCERFLLVVQNGDKIVNEVL